MNRKEKITKAPFLRDSGTVWSLMGDVLIALAFLCIMPILFYGFRVVKNLVFSLAICYFLDLLITSRKTKKYEFRDVSSLVTGTIIVLLFPASIDLWIIIAADVFAILVAKHPFGGLGNNPFNPAAAAYCFCAVSWSDKVFNFTKPMQWLNIFGSVGETVKTADTMAQNLNNGGKPLTDVFDIFSGNVAGAAGATSVIVIVAAGAYLIYRRAISIQISAGVIIGAAVFSVIFPRISTGVLDSIWFELVSGVLLFGAVFMAPEPVTSCKHPYAKWIYGVLIGVITMLFRHFGKMEIAFPFALLIVNSLTPFLDKIGTGIDRYTDLTPRLPKELRKAKTIEGGADNE